MGLQKLFSSNPFFYIGLLRLRLERSLQYHNLRARENAPEVSGPIPSTQMSLMWLPTYNSVLAAGYTMSLLAFITS